MSLAEFPDFAMNQCVPKAGEAQQEELSNTGGISHGELILQNKVNMIKSIDHWR